MAPPGAAITSGPYSMWGDSSPYGRSLVTPFANGYGSNLGKYVASEPPVTLQETADTVLQTRLALYFNAAVAMPDVCTRNHGLSPWGESHQPYNACDIFQYAVLAEVPIWQVPRSAIKLAQPRVTAALNGIHPETALAAPTTVGEAYVRFCDVDTNLQFSGIAKDDRRFERLKTMALGELDSDLQPTAARSERCVAAGYMGTFTVTTLDPGAGSSEPIATANESMVACAPRPRFNVTTDADRPWSSSYFVDQFPMVDKHIKPGVVPVSMKSVKTAIRDDVRNLFTCAEIIYNDILAHADDESRVPMFKRGTCFPTLYKDLLFTTSYTGMTLFVEVIETVEKLRSGTSGDGEELDGETARVSAVFRTYATRRDNNEVQTKCMDSALFACAIHIVAQRNPDGLNAATVIDELVKGATTRLTSVARYLGNFRAMSYTKSKREVSGFVLRR